MALAETASSMGAQVSLILGPGSVFPKSKEIDVIHFVSAKEMYDACIKIFPESDCAIMAAAVSDFEPDSIHDHKVKRGKEDLVIRLKPTRDIAGSLGERKRKDQLLVGFALETNDEIKNARKKLEKKNLDFIVLNSLQDPGAGFGYETNKISILDKNNKIQHFELKSKSEVSEDILKKVAEFFDVK